MAGGNGELIACEGSFVFGPDDIQSGCDTKHKCRGHGYIICAICDQPVADHMFPDCPPMAPKGKRLDLRFIHAVSREPID